MKILDSALKHGFTTIEITSVIESAITARQLPDGIILFLGWCRAELLEVLVDTKDGDYVVFHCMKASRHVRRSK